MTFCTDGVVKALNELKEHAPAVRDMIADMRSECAREVAGAPLNHAKWAGYQMRLASYVEALYTLHREVQIVKGRANESREDQPRGRQA